MTAELSSVGPGYALGEEHRLSKLPGSSYATLLDTRERSQLAIVGFDGQGSQFILIVRARLQQLKCASLIVYDQIEKCVSHFDQGTRRITLQQ